MNRDDLMQQCTGKLTLTCKPQVEAGQAGDPDLCVLLYPRAVWEEKREEIRRFPSERTRRTLIGNAQAVEADKSGRILVPPELREMALLTREVVLIGMGPYFELWDAAERKRRDAEDRAKPPPEGVEHLLLG